MTLEALKTSNHEMIKVHTLIRDMINIQPKQRIPLENVVTKLKTWFPATAMSYNNQESRTIGQLAEKEPMDVTQHTNKELAQQSNTSKEIDSGIDRGNTNNTTAAGDSSGKNTADVK